MRTKKQILETTTLFSLAFIFVSQICNAGIEDEFELKGIICQAGSYNNLGAIAVIKEKSTRKTFFVKSGTKLSGRKDVFVSSISSKNIKISAASNIIVLGFSGYSSFQKEAEKIFLETKESIDDLVRYGVDFEKVPQEFRNLDANEFKEKYSTYLLTNLDEQKWAGQISEAEYDLMVESVGITVETMQKYFAEYQKQKNL